MTEPYADLSVQNDPQIRAVHPGEIIRSDWVEGAGYSVAHLAKAMDVARSTMNDIVRGKRGISADMACRLEIGLGVSARTWLNLQLAYDLAIEREAASKRTGVRPIMDLAV